MATEPASAILRPTRPPFWRNPRVRGIVYQALFVAVVVAVGTFLVHNTLVNLHRQNIATGFGFLDREAGFGIGESLIPYSPADTYGRAFLVGLLNTLYVAALGIVLATVLGTVDRHRPAVQQLARQQTVANLCGDLPQHPAAAAAVLLVGNVARECARSAAGLAAGDGRIHQQSRREFPGAGGQSGALLDADRADCRWALALLR